MFTTPNMETIGDLKGVKECPDCASVNILFSQAREQVICRECGLIFEPFVPDVEKVEKGFSRSEKSGKGKKSFKPAKMSAAKSKKASKPAKSAKKRR